MKKLLFHSLALVFLVLISCAKQADYQGIWYAYDGQGKQIQVEMNTTEMHVKDQVGNRKSFAYRLEKNDSSAASAYKLHLSSGKVYDFIFMDQQQTVAQILDPNGNIVYTLTRFEMNP